MRDASIIIGDCLASLRGLPDQSVHTCVTFPPDLIEPCILAGSPRGGAVLDPFGGSGTTAGVAIKYGRRAILCELNDGYEPLIRERIRSIAGDVGDMFMEAAE